MNHLVPAKRIANQTFGLRHNAATLYDISEFVEESWVGAGRNGPESDQIASTTKVVHLGFDEYLHPPFCYGARETAFNRYPALLTQIQ